MDTISRSVGAGLLTLVFLGGVGYLLYVALFSVS
jgi:preprotein translocase subunit Sss1